MCRLNCSLDNKHIKTMRIPQLLHFDRYVWLSFSMKVNLIDFIYASAGIITAKINHVCITN